METPRKKIHRFFLDFDASARSLVVADPDLVHQWTKVLRFAPGEVIQLFSNGLEIEGTIVKMFDGKIELKLGTAHQALAEPSRKLTAYVSMFRKEPFEWLLEKLTEVGVSVIVPIESARTIRFPWRPDRFKSILKESAEQSGRGVVPSLEELMKFSEVIARAKNDHIYLFEIGGVKIKKPTASAVSFLIGPEGGWSSQEIESAKSAGIHVVGLGNQILRAETAALLAAYELLQ